MDMGKDRIGEQAAGMGRMGDYIFLEFSDILQRPKQTKLKIASPTRRLQLSRQHSERPGTEGGAGVGCDPQTYADRVLSVVEKVVVV